MPRAFKTRSGGMRWCKASRMRAEIREAWTAGKDLETTHMYIEADLK
jgi:hypothetical protein